MRPAYKGHAQCPAKGNQAINRNYLFARKLSSIVADIMKWRKFYFLYNNIHPEKSPIFVV